MAAIVNQEEEGFFDDVNTRHCQSVSLASNMYQKVEESFAEDDDFGDETGKSFAEMMFANAQEP